jgi:hypothetical protein
LSAATVLAILPAASALSSVSLSLVRVVLARTAKPAFTAPLMPISLALRLVWCIIHALFTCESLVFAGFAYMGACAPGPDLDVIRLTFLVKSSVLVSALARASRTGTGGNQKTPRYYHEQTHSH